MKKVSLLSLVAVLAISTGTKANVENPFYMPAEGKLYSKTSVNKAKSIWNFQEEVGIGATNRLTLAAAIDSQWDTDSTKDGLSFWKIATKYRLSDGKWLSDLYLDYSKSIDEDVWGTKKANTFNAGIKTGLRKEKYALAFNAGLNRIKYENIDSNNIEAGIEYAYNFDSRLSGSINLDYILTDDANFRTWDDQDSLMAKFQVNYLKGGLWSLYYTTELKADDVDNAFGLKYGVQF